MHSLLSKFLKKRGIESVDLLTTEERDTFQTYERVLSKQELTMDDLRHFLTTQVSLIEAKWRDHGIEQARKAELIPYHTAYKTLLEAIDAPKAEKEAMEKYLIQLTQ